MPTSRVRYTLTPSPEMIREGRRLADMLRRFLRPGKYLQKSVGDAVRDGINLNFERQRAGDGPAWVRLSPYTVEDRIRQGYPGERPILVRSGEYRRGLTDDRHHEHLVRLRTRNMGWDMDITSTDYRLSTHEGGRPPIPGFNAAIPARPALILSRQAERWIEEALRNYFMGVEPGDPTGDNAGLLHHSRTRRT